MTGAGKVPLPQRTVDYLVKPKLVGSIEGQGGGSDVAGVTVPIKVTGPWHDISYKPDLEGMLKDQLKDPAAALENLQDGEGAKGLLERSEEHTSELQSLMRITYAVFCLKKKHNSTTQTLKLLTATKYESNTCDTQRDK